MESSGVKLNKAAFVDIDAAEVNFHLTRKITGKKRIIAVVKANAYGHGAVRLSQLYSELGADMLAVSSVDEALELRRGGVSLPVIILGYTPVEFASVLCDCKLIQCIFSEEYAVALSASAVSQCCMVSAHIKIDSGMGRLGFGTGESDACAIIRCLKLPRISYEGIFTHFSSSDKAESGREYTGMQSYRFSRLLSFLSDAGFEFPLVHSSNSGAILDHSQTVRESCAVRAGIMLYGYHPSALVRRRLPLIPVMSLKCSIAQIKTVHKGYKIGYGGRFTAPQDMRIATLPIGYADGIPLGISRVFISDTPCSVVGGVCMDQMMVDVSDVIVTLQDDVTVFGKGESQTADELSADAGIITYSALCGISRRVPRVYTKGGSECDRVNYLGV